MSKLKLVSTIAATALLMSAAQAAPKVQTAPKAVAAPDHVQVRCDVIVKDSNGRVIGQRKFSDDAKGVVGQMRSTLGHQVP